MKVTLQFDMSGSQGVAVAVTEQTVDATTTYCRAFGEGWTMCRVLDQEIRHGNYLTWPTGAPLQGMPR